MGRIEHIGKKHLCKVNIIVYVTQYLIQYIHRDKLVRMVAFGRATGPWGEKGLLFVCCSLPF